MKEMDVETMSFDSVDREDEAKARRRMELINSNQRENTTAGFNSNARGAIKNPGLAEPEENEMQG